MFCDLVMCPRVVGQRCYGLACVLGVCGECGFRNKIWCCATEHALGNAAVNVRLLEMVDIVQAKGQKSKSVRQEKSVVMTYDKFMNDTEEELKTFLVHDFVARHQKNCYSDQWHWLPQDTEIWISDYIENFSCFGSKELQQDYYNKHQITIFIVLVIRRRRPEETISIAEASQTLPSHLTCDVHVFLSNDKAHDDSFAAMSWTKVAAHTKERCN